MLRFTSSSDSSLSTVFFSELSVRSFFFFPSKKRNGTYKSPLSPGIKQTHLLLFQKPRDRMIFYFFFLGPLIIKHLWTLRGEKSNQIFSSICVLFIGHAPSKKMGKSFVPWVRNLRHGTLRGGPSSYFCDSYRIRSTELSFLSKA